MPTWLVEGNPIVYFVLAIGLIFSAAAWWRTRKRPFAIAAGVFAVLILGFWLLDRAVESDGEQMVRKVAEVADAVTRHDLDAAFKHVSDRFERHGFDKAKFRKFCDDMIKKNYVTSVRV